MACQALFIASTIFIGILVVQDSLHEEQKSAQVAWMAQLEASPLRFLVLHSLRLFSPVHAIVLMCQELASVSAPSDVDVLFELEALPTIYIIIYTRTTYSASESHGLRIVPIALLIVPLGGQDADLTKTFKYQKAFVCTICGEAYAALC